MKHTPGPWRIKEQNEGAWEIEAVNPPTLDYGIATLNYTGLDAKANARLIAAAPEMLTALIACKEELFQFHEHWHPDCINDRPDRCPARSALKEAETIIKAIQQ